MKTLIMLLFVLILTSPVFGQAQSAREKLKADPEIAAMALTNAVLDAIVDFLKKREEVDQKARERSAVLERMEKLLENDPQLRQDLRNSQ